MPIKPAFTMVQVNQYMIQQRTRYEQALIDIFKQAGEDAVRYMRSLNTFSDQTANLRNSEGFMLYKDGQPIIETYPNDKQGDGSEPAVGATIGKNLANKVAGEFAPKRGYLLVVTAGMNYALYVESKGYDVITGGSKTAAKFMKRRVLSLHNKLNRRR